MGQTLTIRHDLTVFMPGVFGHQKSNQKQGLITIGEFLQSGRTFIRERIY